MFLDKPIAKKIICSLIGGALTASIVYQTDFEIEKIETKYIASDTEYDKDQIKCLAKNIYFEARGSTVPDQQAVAFVTINRAKAKSWPNTICEVVYQQKKNSRGVVVGQFSWTTMSESERKIKNTQAWDASLNVAKQIYVLINDPGYKNLDITDGANHYYAPGIVARPYWAHHKYVDKEQLIGGHIYLRLKGYK